MIDGTSRKTKGAILAAALATTVAVAAASVGAATTAGPGSQAAPAGTAGKGAVDPRSGGLEVALGEWSIGLEAKAIRPGRVTLVIRNRGKAEHGFEIEAAGEHRDRDDDDQELETDR